MSSNCWPICHCARGSIIGLANPVSLCFWSHLVIMLLYYARRRLSSTVYSIIKVSHSLLDTTHSRQTPSVVNYYEATYRQINLIWRANGHTYVTHLAQVLYHLDDSSEAGGCCVEVWRCSAVCASRAAALFHRAIVCYTRQLWSSLLDTTESLYWVSHVHFASLELLPHICYAM